MVYCAFEDMTKVLRDRGYANYQYIASNVGCDADHK